MADPVSLAAVSIGTGVAGAAVSAGGGLFQGQAQSNMYKYQAGVAQVNSTLATQDANYARSVGGVEEVNAGLKGRAQFGGTRAGIAAGNVDTTTGSGANVLKSETEITQQNEATIAANSAKRAYGFDVKAAQDTAQVGAYDVSASTSETAGDINAISSVIGGAGSVASKWYQYGQSFGPGSNGGGAKIPVTELGG
jgi:hypothetical protein